MRYTCCAEISSADVANNKKVELLSNSTFCFISSRSAITARQLPGRQHREDLPGLR